MHLPNLLTTISGENVSTAHDWEAFRRPEIFGLFERFVYGEKPFTALTPAFCVKQTDTQFLGGAAIYEKTNITLTENGNRFSFPVEYFAPAGIEKPPVFVYIMLQASQSETCDLRVDTDMPFVPISQIIARGYAVAVYKVKDLDPDCDDGFQNGIHTLFSKKPRNAQSWGTIAAWAYGASLVMDCLAASGRADCSRAAVIGHSRGGKTALWAGACDTRFKLVVSNNSGCTGAAASRGSTGETVQLINTRFPYWFCENYHAYNGREAWLPIDQHMLIALIAPRYVYVASASDDDNACPQNELLSARRAGDVYGLYGKRGLDVSGDPAFNTPYHGGAIAYHIREGRHALTPFDWDLFMDYADKVL